MVHPGTDVERFLSWTELNVCSVTVLGAKKVCFIVLMTLSMGLFSRLNETQLVSITVQAEDSVGHTDLAVLSFPPTRLFSICHAVNVVWVFLNV